MHFLNIKSNCYSIKRALTPFFLVLALTISIPAAAQDLRIAIEEAYPPFSQINPDGSLSGFDVDITHALCSAMGYDCILIQKDWDGIIPALLAKKYDAIIASMAITEERKEKVAFTNRYYQMIVKFIRPKGSDLVLSPQGLKGKRIGVQIGTVFDDYATDNFNQAEIVRYANHEEVFLDLQTGRIDTTLTARPVAELGFLNTPAGKDFELFGPDIINTRWFGEGIGIALRKKDTKLLEEFNDAIATIRQNGEYQRINDKYFSYDIYGD